jgi:hypothetical protein
MCTILHLGQRTQKEAQSIPYFWIDGSDTVFDAIQRATQGLAKSNVK